MKIKKEFLKNKIINFQLKINRLNKNLAEQKNKYENKENEYIINLLELLDAFEILNENIKEKEEFLDKSALMLLRNVKAIQNKVLHFLKANNICSIEFNNNKAKIECCKIIDTRQDSAKDNETILSIIKKGYVNIETNKIIRKAEVITVKN